MKSKKLKVQKKKKVKAHYEVYKPDPLPIITENLFQKVLLLYGVYSKTSTLELVIKRDWEQT